MNKAILEIPGERDRKDTCWARMKVKKPVRLTPSMEQFRATVEGAK